MRIEPIDETAPDRMTELPTWLLNQAALQGHRLLAHAFGPSGSRDYHYRMLAALAECGPASQAALGRRTGIDRSDVVATVDDLVARGFVRRAQDRTDRRRNVVTMTARGRRHYERLDTLAAAAQDELLEPLSDAQRHTLVKLLRRVVIDR